MDAESGEELIGATVQVQNTGAGTVTDISGNYQLSLDPGTYTMVYSYVSYSPKTVEGVAIKAGEVNRIDISLQSDDVQLQEVVVQAEQINNNEVALLKLQQKSLAVQDGISVDQIRRIGATNSADAMKNVTGASVEEGKYVVMRGLGDRYSNTQVNGVTLPSTDPYRNSASLDLIPSTMIENVVTTKTFTPDQPGNFTGGNVDVSTKSIPDQFYLSTGISVGYNTLSSFQDDFLTDPTSSNTDWLGYGTDARQVPDFLDNEENRRLLQSNIFINFSRPANEDQRNQEARQLVENSTEVLRNRSFVPQENRSLLNHRFQFSMGDRKEIGGRSLGYNIGLNYRRAYRHYPDRILNIWRVSGDPESSQLIEFLNTSGRQSTDNPTLGGLASIAYQLNNKNELSLNYMYNNDVESTAASLQGIRPGAISGNHTFFTRGISYLQRTVNNVQLQGKHSFGVKNIKLDWTLGYTASDQNEPDIRLFAYDLRRSGYGIDASEYNRPVHFFRTLNDRQYSGKFDVEIPVGEEGKHTFKLGAMARRKNRDFSELRFQHETTRLRDDDYLTFEAADGNTEAFFAEDNYGIRGQNPDGSFQVGPYFSDRTLPSNAYTGEEQVIAGYLMGVYQANNKWKFIGGVRAEQTNFEVKTENERDSVGIIDQLDFLPSLNVVYALTDKSNLRVAGSRTLARPNMREIAPFASFDFIGGFLYAGNPNLERTTVWNADLRYELFPTAGELVAVSAFYKDFTNPIQQLLVPVASGGEVTFTNVDQGILYGIELEFRKKLGFIGKSAFFENVSFTTNFTYTFSEVDLTEDELTNRRRFNSDIESTRPFQAQSPYIWNINLTYYNPESEFEATVYMNMYGRRLFANGFGAVPDVYEINGNGNTPVPDLRVNINKRIFERMSVGLRIENILDYKTERNVEFRGNYFIQDQFAPGRTFTVSVGYSIN